MPYPGSPTSESGAEIAALPSGSLPPFGSCSALLTALRKLQSSEESSSMDIDRKGVGARGWSGLDICEWVCSDLTKISTVGRVVADCVVRVCKASKDPFARRALKAASSQQFLSVGIFSLHIEFCQGFIGLYVPRMTQVSLT